MKLLINLASRCYLNQRALNLALSATIMLLVVVLLLQLNGYLEDRRQAATYESHLRELQQQLQGEQPQRLDPAELESRQQTYRQAQRLLERDGFQWTALLSQMEELLPEGISLRRFQPDYGGRSLALSGVARNLVSLQQLLSNLQTADFSSVYLTRQNRVSISDRSGAQRDALSFTIALEGVF